MVFSPFTPPKPSRTTHNRWGSQWRPSIALAISQLAQRLQGMHLVVTETSQQATQIYQDLVSFTPLSTNHPTENKLSIFEFPDWETLPYDHFSPHQDIISARLETLYQLPLCKNGILVIPVSTLMHRFIPKAFVQSQSLDLIVGQTLSLEQFREQLHQAGYRAVDTVFSCGEFALRGSVMDVFPSGSDTPLRIEWFDDDVETLRTFDPETQLTIEAINAIKLLPAQEFPLDDAGIRLFRSRWREQFDGNPRDCAIFNEISKGISSSGIEYYLPLFFEEMASLFDYLPEDVTIYQIGDLQTAAQQFWGDIQERYINLNVDVRRPLMPPSELFLPVETIFQHCKSKISITSHIGEPDPDHAFAQALPDVSAQNIQTNPLEALKDFFEQWQGDVLFSAESTGRREILINQLQKIGYQPTVFGHFSEFTQQADAQSQPLTGVVVSPLESGLILPEKASNKKLALISEADIFGVKLSSNRGSKKGSQNADHTIKHLTELNLGSAVVHIDHGVGRYRGLEVMAIEGDAHEFLALEYAAKAMLYVPVANLHLISRYSGSDSDQAPLNKLGTDHWEKSKRKAAEKIRDTAAELLDVYAKRAARKGYAFNESEGAYQRFANEFPFAETPDQAEAITSVRKDMLSSQPMDRLVCGDVGFGKTEVAMRAAFLAAHDGKQVAVLVPTTLLAQQHFENFSDRFANWPINIGLLSRFRSSKQLTETLEKTAKGEIDILIGTHKLIQSDVKYSALGLVIIDEEHRFGVRQKEQLKSLRAEVDILALTATPIPRTLNLSMQGVRDLSIIATPPAKRLSIKTFVQEAQPSLIKEAISREIMRGGQVYYLHNEVKTIEKTAHDLEELIPNAKVGIGHGQMRERELEKVMSDFYHKRFNILVCTTIIETGIDIPNANTIVIHRADKFGLAQLHQLRGRVGRSHHQAYAYLLTPPARSLTPDATKRLEAISAASDLGAGFTLATHDLEIRGAGELLGEEQSGQIEHIGFTLYMEMLDEAVKSLQQNKSAKVADKKSNTEMNLRISALIPDDYLPDVHLRLTLYKRLANAENTKALEQLQIEMIDRFGLLPDSTKNLFLQAQLRITAEKLGIVKVEANINKITVQFNAEPNVDPVKLVKLVQESPQTYQLSGGNQLAMRKLTQSAQERLTATETLLRQLAI